MRVRAAERESEEEEEGSSLDGKISVARERERFSIPLFSIFINSFFTDSNF